MGAVLGAIPWLNLEGEEEIENNVISTIYSMKFGEFFVLLFLSSMGV